MKKIILLGIRLYQKLISPLLGAQCLYYPTCSQYAVETLEEKPLITALPKITLRMLSCNPINGFLKYRRAKS